MPLSIELEVQLTVVSVRGPTFNRYGPAWVGNDRKVYGDLHIHIMK